MYDWDEEKRKSNLEKHGVDFAIINSFEWDRATTLLDDRSPYGERRYIAFGPIASRLYCVWYTKRGRRYRIIGIRKANRREVKRYG